MLMMMETGCRKGDTIVVFVFVLWEVYCTSRHVRVDFEAIIDNFVVILLSPSGTVPPFPIFFLQNKERHPSFKKRSP